MAQVKECFEKSYKVHENTIIILYHFHVTIKALLSTLYNQKPNNNYCYTSKFQCLGVLNAVPTTCLESSVKKTSNCKCKKIDVCEKIKVNIFTVQ